jgi:hypothetical protein
MPEKTTIERAREDARAGKLRPRKPVSLSAKKCTMPGRQARNTKQAIAIGLSKARRAGVIRESFRRPPPFRSGIYVVTDSGL